MDGLRLPHGIATRVRLPRFLPLDEERRWLDKRKNRKKRGGGEIE
jgi:hypothetical protein